MTPGVPGVDANSGASDNFDTSPTLDLLSAGNDNEQVLTIQYTRPPSGPLLSPSATTVLLQTDDDGIVDCLVSGVALQSSGVN